MSSGLQRNGCILDSLDIDRENMFRAGIEANNLIGLLHAPYEIKMFSLVYLEFLKYNFQLSFINKFLKTSYKTPFQTECMKQLNSLCAMSFHDVESHDCPSHGSPHLFSSSNQLFTLNHLSLCPISRSFR